MTDMIEQLHRQQDEIRQLTDQLNAALEENLKLQEINKDLIQIHKSQSDFTSMVTHELRTPLCCIKMTIDTVLEGIDGPLTPMQQETLTISLKNVERLDKLIDNVLDFSKFQSGKMEMFFAQNDVTSLISESLTFMNPVAQKKKVLFNHDLPTTPLPADCDADKIKQVAINLIDNAIKFTPEGGEVLVTLSQQMDFILLEVRDTGIGIKKEDHETIFRMFSQSNDLPFSGKLKGTGIGLAICKKIAEQHSGTLTVSSVPGKGSNFLFRIPQSQKEPHPVIQQ